MESGRLLQHLTSASACSDIDSLLDHLEQKAFQEGEKLVHDSTFQLEVGPYTVFPSGGCACADVDLGQTELSNMASHSTSSEEHTESCATFDFTSFSYEPSIDLDQEMSGPNSGNPIDSTFDSNKGLNSAVVSTGCYINAQVSDAQSFELPELSMLSNSTLQTCAGVVAGQLPNEPVQIPLPAVSQIPSLSTGSPYLPPDVRFLLHHYDDIVIDSLSAIPLPQEKAPWRDLHLPSALRAYGELDVLGNSSLARVSLLYSLLSLTCYHLSSLYSSVDITTAPCSSNEQSFNPNSNTEYWRTQAQKFQAIGRTAFQKHLESTQSHKQKYKESLMAAMSLICVDVISGDTSDARIHIRQCEKIIRKATECHRQFSERALQLHRIFAFMMIMEQSTFCHSEGDHVDCLKNNINHAGEMSLVEEMTTGQDNFVLGCLVTTQSDVPGSDMPLHRREADGFNNLYGASGKLFEMLAKTNILVNKMAISVRNSKSSRYVVPEELFDEAAELEQSICDWATNFEALPDIFNIADLCDDLPFDEVSLLAKSSGRDVPSAMATCMHVAIYYALLVYFFREVRNTNPKILQHYVRKVIACLEYHKSLKTRFYPTKRIGTIVWPSFIVACEALSSELRHRAIMCIRQSVAAGFRNGEIAESVVRKVWTRRDAGDANVSWREIVCQLKAFMLLS